MAFVVEDGTGLDTATAYISVEFADEYHSDRCNDGWAGANTAKQAAIIKATEYIDRNFEFVGGLVKDTEGDPQQALMWPRIGGVDDEGRFIDDESVPLAVQRATAELALQAIRLGALEAQVVTANVIRYTERVGDVSMAASYDGPQPMADANDSGSFSPSSFPVVVSLLRPLLAGDALARA